MPNGDVMRAQGAPHGPLDVSFPNGWVTSDGSHVGLMVVHVLPIATHCQVPKKRPKLPGQLAIGLGIGGTSAARTLRACPFVSEPKRAKDKTHQTVRQPEKHQNLHRLVCTA